MCRFKLSQILITSLILLLLTISTNADVPQVINYQGRLTDLGGNPVADGSYSVVFTIYDAATVGNSKWTETQSITTNNGLFAVLLGTINPIIDTVFNGTTRYLSLEVAGDPELIPRTALVTVPYAHRVSTIDGASGGNVTSKVSIGPGHTLSGDSAGIGGGYNNVASGPGSTVGGGNGNSADGIDASVAGGQNNHATGYCSSVGGGSDNTASHNYTTVAGGTSNSVTNGCSNIAGGIQNSISGNYSSILGGFADTITSSYGYLFGINANLEQDSTFRVDMPHIQFGSAASGYEFPSVDGTSGQVLATDGSGQIDWTNPGGGANGWVDDGTIVRLETINDTVRIGDYNGGAAVNISRSNSLGFGSLTTGLGVWTESVDVMGTSAGYFSADGGAGLTKAVHALGSSTTTDTVFSFKGLATNFGTGPAIGIWGETDFEGTGDKIGVRGRGCGAGAGDTYGGYFSTAGGMSNTGFKYGVYAYGHNLTSSNAYGVYGEAYNPNDGIVIGGYFTTSGSGSGLRYGVATSGVSNNSSTAYGISAISKNDGSGNATAGYFHTQPLGTGEKRAIYAVASSDGSESGYGIDLETYNNGSGISYGLYSETESTSGGEIYGGHFDVTSSSAVRSTGLVVDATCSNTGNIDGITCTATSTSTGIVSGGAFNANGNRNVYGVTGTADGNDADYVRGVWGYAENLGSGPAEAGYFSASNNGTGIHYGVYAYELAGGSGAAVYAVGDFVASGTKSGVMRTSKGTTLMYAMESSEVWFEDFGDGRLINGQAHIELDPLFLEMVTIDNAQPMKVFIQLNDDCNGTYVKTSLTGFDVFELNQGISEASFTYRVVAKRKGYESERMRTAEIGHEDPNLYPERAEEILEKMQAKSRTE